MTPLILGVDSGLDGAFCWMRGGEVLHTVLTKSIVSGGAIGMHALKGKDALAFDTAMMFGKGRPTRQVAYLEEPFNASISGGASTAGYTDQCKRWGRLQGWLESWGYEVRGVQAKTWQRELLDLARFEIRTEKACKPRLAEGWTLTKPKAGTAWRLRGPYGIDASAFGAARQLAIMDAGHSMPGAVTKTKTVLSHDTKAASVAYAREHFSDVELVPARSRNPHDGLSDAICIAAWATKQLSKETP